MSMRVFFFRTGRKAALAASMYKPGKATPQCLSHWRLSSLLIDAAASPTASEQAHLDTCAVCQATWQQERALVIERRQQGLPAYLQRALAAHGLAHKQEGRPFGSSWWPSLAFASAAAAAAFGLVAMWPAHESATERIKGKVPNEGKSEIHLSVLRGEALIVHDVAFGQQPPLMDGDRIRLRLLTTKRWFGLWTEEGTEWTSLAQGSVPQDGWLSVGFRYNSKHRTAMTVLLCPQEPVQKTKALQPTKHPKGCERVQFGL